MTDRYRIPGSKQSRLISAVLFLVACAWLTGCSRQTNDALPEELQGPPSRATYDLDIKRQSGVLAMLEFASQTRLNVSISPDLLDTPLIVGPFKGEETADRALSALLAQSDWTYEWVNDRTLIVKADAKQQWNSLTATAFWGSGQQEQSARC